MKTAIAILTALAIAACVDTPATSKIESGLCSIEDQLVGACTGPFALLPQHTIDYATSNAPPGTVALEDDLWCAQAGTNVTCGISISFPGYTVNVTCWIDTDHPNWPPECKSNTTGPNHMDLVPTTSLCTVQDQIEGRCEGPFSLLSSYTRDYAADIDPAAHGELNCYRTGPITQCSLFVDVPGYTIVVLCAQYDGEAAPLCSTSVVPNVKVRTAAPTSDLCSYDADTGQWDCGTQPGGGGGGGGGPPPVNSCPYATCNPTLGLGQNVMCQGLCGFNNTAWCQSYTSDGDQSQGYCANWH